MKTKSISIAVTAALCIGLFAGCQSSALHSRSDEESEAAASASEDAASEAKDYTPAYESYDPDEVMLTVNGLDVSWGELFYWYQSNVSNIENYYGDITDWDADSGLIEDTTFREYVTDGALDMVKHYYALESKAGELGVTLTEEDKETLAAIWQNNVDSYGNGDETAFIEYLNTLFLPRALYDHINEVSMLYDRVCQELFGANGEKLDAEEVTEKAGDLGYVRAKHILFLSKDDTETELPEEQLAEKRATAETLLEELRAITDPSALEARFDALIAEYGEDPGTEYFTEGYTFIAGSGSMDSAFDAAVTALDAFGLSELVESDFGYHIILRLPLKADAAVEYISETEMSPLAYYVAQEQFGSETENWAQESKVEYTDVYNALDIAEVFSKAVRPAA
jgi:parvulin-like peptidyl-prolyl isomerase